MTGALVERRQDLYENLFRDHTPLLHRIVRKAGIPTHLIEDVVSEIVIRMLDQNGLERFDGSKPLTHYLSSYVSLSSRAWRDRVLTENSRRADLDTLRETPATDPADDDIEFLVTLLFEIQDPDARIFLMRAFDTLSYHDAREQLLSEGWEPMRISRAVRRARAGTRRLVCTT